MLADAHLPSISVVIPSYNQGHLIEETLISVLGQQYPRLEVIVIDGGSNDSSVEVLRRYAGQLTYWHSQPDQGQADAINLGMRRSSGQILCWLNSDDMFLPGTLLDAGRRLAPQIDRPALLYGDALTIHQGSGTLAGGAQSAGSFDATRLTYSDYLVQPSTFWTRRLWQATGELNVAYRYVLDWDWFIRASQHAAFCRVERHYAIYRAHPDHKTGNGADARRSEIYQVVRRYASSYWQRLYHATLGCYPQVRQLLNWLIAHRVPKPTLFLLLRFPQLLRRLRRPHDLHTVLQMYG